MVQDTQKGPYTQEGSEQELEDFRLRQKIIDMMVYAFPLIEKWSVSHQKLLGDDIAHCMNEMLELAAALVTDEAKKAHCKNLDCKNKALQDYITTAYKLKYLEGASSHAEWTKRSKEIGKSIGKYKQWIYNDITKKSPEEKKPSTKKNYYGNRGRTY